MVLKERSCILTFLPATSWSGWGTGTVLGLAMTGSEEQGKDTALGRGELAVEW
jgi:hypothetical protein